MNLESMDKNEIHVLKKLNSKNGRQLEMQLLFVDLAFQ